MTFTISFGENIKQPDNIKKISFDRFINSLNSDYMKNKISALRAASSADKKAEIKVGLPYVVASHFVNDEKRHTSCFEKSKGLILDVDHVDTADLIEKLRFEPLIHFAFISPSGDGVKVGIKFSRYISNAAEYSSIYKACAKTFSNYFGVEVDKTSDCARACFLSYDANFYLNDDPELWNPIPEKSKKKEYISRIKHDDIDMQIITDLCRRANISEYHDWLRCGMALFSLGEPGRDMFKLLSLGKGSKDTERDIDVKFDSFRGVQKVSIGSFFHIMKSYGYTYDIQRKKNDGIDHDDAELHRREWLEERAAILEFYAGYSRDEADLKALEIWNRRVKK